MLSEHDFARTLDWLSRFRRPLLVSHRRPDGDAIGSLMAMVRIAELRGLAPQPVLFEPLAPRYVMLDAGTRWTMWDAGLPGRVSPDALIVLDTCARSQLEPLIPWLDDPPPTLVVDHHATRDPIGTRPSDCVLIDETAGACCLILTELVLATKLPLDQTLARALLLGIATDTGFFRFSNSNGRLLRAAAALVDAGAAIHELFEAIQQQDPPERLRLVGRMLTGMQLRHDGKLVVLRLRQSDFHAAGANPAMTEDLVNEAGRLAGVEATLLAVEEPDAQVRVNLRSRRWLDVSAVAGEFGGGGHLRAAGARVRGTLDDVVEQVAQAIERRLAAKLQEESLAGTGPDT